MNFRLMGTLVVLVWGLRAQDGNAPTSRPESRSPESRAVASRPASRGAAKDFVDQIHIAFGDDPRTSMRVVWQTASESTGARVEFGRTDKPDHVAAARRVKFTGETGPVYEATLTGMKPGRMYRYRVGDPVHGYSDIMKFKTAPPGPADFSFTAFGDHGVKKDSWAALNSVRDEKPDFHVLLGDVSYANGDGRVWDRYLHMIEGFASEHPFMTVVGNHENEVVGTTKLGFANYLGRFAMPGTELHYTFDYGDVRFVAVNSEDLRFEPGTEATDRAELAWLDQKLAAARADAKVHWLIVLQHHVIFGSEKGKGFNMSLVQAEVPILDKYKVDLLLNGHFHAYERFYPLREGKPVTEEKTTYTRGVGTVFVTCGGGGQELRPAMPKPSPLAVVTESTWCHLNVHVTANGPLTVSARRPDHTVLDTFTIR